MSETLPLTTQLREREGTATEKGMIRNAALAFSFPVKPLPWLRCLQSDCTAFGRPSTEEGTPSTPRRPRKGQRILESNRKLGAAPVCSIFNESFPVQAEGTVSGGREAAAIKLSHENGGSDPVALGATFVFSLVPQGRFDAAAAHVNT